MTFLSRHIRLWVVVISAAVFLSLGAWAYRAASLRWQLHAAALPSLPAHTVTLQETSHGSNLTAQTTIIYARRSDGSGLRLIRRADSFSPTGETENKTLHLTTGVFVNSYGDVGMKTTRVRDPSDPMVKAQLLMLRDPATNCTKNFSGGNPSAIQPTSETMDNVEGYPALKTVSDSGDSVWTIWRAPAFGCDIVKQHVDFKDGGYSDQLPTQLQLGEPNPALFDVSGFKEASPLEAATASAQLHHRRLTDKEKAALNRFESKYQSLKPKAP